MHLHGIPQTVVAKDGWPLPTPYFEDTVLVAPGERVDVHRRRHRARGVGLPLPHPDPRRRRRRDVRHGHGADRRAVTVSRQAPGGLPAGFVGLAASHRLRSEPAAGAGRLWSSGRVPWTDGIVERPPVAGVRRYLVDLRLRLGAEDAAVTTFRKAAYLDLGAPRRTDDWLGARHQLARGECGAALPGLRRPPGHRGRGDEDRGHLRATWRRRWPRCRPSSAPRGRQRHCTLGAGPDRSRRGLSTRAAGGRLTEVMLGDEGRGLRAALKVQLREDAADVVLDRLVGQEDLGCDLLVRLALGDEEQDLPFLRREVGELVGRRRRWPPAERAGAPSRSPPGRAASRRVPTDSIAATRSRPRTCLRR